MSIVVDVLSQINPIARIELMVLAVLMLIANEFIFRNQKMGRMTTRFNFMFMAEDQEHESSVKAFSMARYISGYFIPASILSFVYLPRTVAILTATILWLMAAAVLLSWRRLFLRECDK